MMQEYVTGEQNDRVQVGSPPRQPLSPGCNQQRAPANSEINSIETVVQRIHTPAVYEGDTAGSVVILRLRIFPRWIPGKFIPIAFPAGLNISIFHVRGCLDC